MKHTKLEVPLRKGKEKAPFARKICWVWTLVVQLCGTLLAITSALTAIVPLLEDFKTQAQTISFVITKNTLFFWAIALLSFIASSFAFALARTMNQRKPRFIKIVSIIFEAIVTGISVLGIIITGFLAFLKLIFPSYSYEFSSTKFPELFLEIVLLAYISSLAIIGARHYSNKLHDFIALILE